jgi:hypothetical protein
MKRENRRIAAMSWGAGDDEPPPPKPSRTPMMDSTSKLFTIEDRSENGTDASMTYIIAQNPAVLAQLMREHERRGVNPSSYTTPASVFNVLAVDFDAATENKPVEDIPLKTIQMPANELIPLKQDTINLIPDSAFSQSSPQNPIPSPFPNSDILGANNEIITSPSGLPPQAPSSDNSKSRSLDRNAGQGPSVFARISSLERRQQQLQENMKNNQRSQSLIRQFSAGVQETEIPAMRSASLERNQQLPFNFKAPYSNSFDKFQNPPPPPYVKPTLKTVKGGSLERSQAIIMNDLMRKYYDQKAAADAQKPRSGGSLERNSQYQQFLLIQKQQLQQQLHAQQQQVQQQQKFQQQMQQQQQQQEEAIEENIYDFGGVHVKSCATIALKKSIERGMLPPSALRSFESASNSPSGPSSLELIQNRPVTPQGALSNTFKQPCPSIASRMMIFQQGISQPIRTPTLQNPAKPFPPNQNFYMPPVQPESIQVRIHRE